MSRDNEKKIGLDSEIKIIISRYLKSYETFQELNKELKEDKVQYQKDGLLIKEYLNKQNKQGIGNPKITGKKYNIIFKKKKGITRFKSIKKVKDIFKNENISMNLFFKLTSEGKETCLISVEKNIPKENDVEMQGEIDIV